MPMRSMSGEYESVEQFVVNFILKKDGIFTYEKLEKAVNKEFPQSNFNKTHLPHYRRVIEDGIYGRIKKHVIENISDSIRANGKAILPSKKKSIKSGRKQSELQEAGHKLLHKVRKEIEKTAGSNKDREFKLHRFVWVRMQGDEQKVKRQIKKELLDKYGSRCTSCGKTFESGKTLEVHRKDEAKGYSIDRSDDCTLLCKPCHASM